MDATRSVVLDIIDEGTAAEIPPPTVTDKAALRYFQREVIFNEDEFIVIAVKAVPGETVSSGAVSEVLLRGERWIAP
jgi:hypothetical protein